MPTKSIPIGVDNFAKLVDKENNYLFTDKTLLIKEVIDDKSEVTLITRPRRWGKTLNLSMLQHFFAAQVRGCSTQGLFSNLKIAQANEGAYLHYQGQYPVIFISFKDVKEKEFDKALAKIKSLVKELYREHEFLLLSDKLSEASKKIFNDYLNGEPGQAELEQAIKLLSELLSKHYGKSVYILIDEYDAPLNAAYGNYLDDITLFMKNLFSAALKGNSYLKKGLMTGILRISKASMLSGLNNVKTHALLDDKRYKEYFGFTEQEVDDLFSQYELEIKPEEIKAWYNGYQIANQVLYNPWSIMSCIDNNGEIGAYWVNTADDSLLVEALLGASDDTKEKFNAMLSGQAVECTISEHIAFEQLKTSDIALWSLLHAAGYIKAIEVKTHDKIQYECKVDIPNKEVQALYVNIFKNWLQESLGESNYRSFISQLVEGDVEAFGKQVGNFLLRHTSTHDFPKESNYHTFFLGLISSVIYTHETYSNIESGLGRPDVMLVPRDKQKSLALILEFKHAKPQDDIKRVAQQALEQIKLNQYQANIEQKAHIKDVLKIGIAFAKKEIGWAYSTLNLATQQDSQIQSLEHSIEFDEESSSSSPVSSASSSQTMAQPRGRKRGRGVISSDEESEGEAEASIAVQASRQPESNKDRASKASRLAVSTDAASSSSRHRLFTEQSQASSQNAHRNREQDDSPIPQ